VAKKGELHNSCNQTPARDRKTGGAKGKQNTYTIATDTQTGATKQGAIEQIELQAKLLNYFLGSNKSNINQSVEENLQSQLTHSPPTPD